MCRPLYSSLALLTIALPLAAQVPVSRIRGPAPSVLFAVAPTLHATTMLDSLRNSIPATQWKRGMLIGGIAGGVGLGALGIAVCQSLREANQGCVGPGLGLTAIGAVLGGTIGALIGGQFPRRLLVPVDSSSTGQ